MGFENRDYYREDDRPNIRMSFPKVSPLFMGIAGACLVMFLLQTATGGRPAASPMAESLKLTFDNALAVTQPWRWITYQYLHGNTPHLFFNMLFLYFFLPWLEEKWGWQKTLAFYTLGGIAAGVAYGLLSLVFPGFRGTGLIGASGSIFAILGGCALFYPDRRIIFIIVPMTVRALAALYGVFFLLSSFADRNFSDAAHLGGLLFGFFAPYLAGPKLRDWQEGLAHRRRVREQQAQVDEQAEIDRILAKVSASGMHSLTRGEQKVLKHATERQQARERSRGTR